MRIIICDDDRNILDRYTKVLKELGEKHKIKQDVSGYISGEELLFELPENPDEIDLIYLDIHFGNKMDGMEVAKKLRKVGYTNQIIFLTVDREKVFESFDVDPLYFFVKEDVSATKFEEVFLKAIRRIRSKEEEILSLSCAGQNRNIPVEDIRYFEVVQRIITVYYGKESFEFYSTMGKLENLLAHRGFVRVHRGYIVALRHIVSVKNSEILLTNDVRIPVGRTYMKNLRDKIK